MYIELALPNLPKKAKELAALSSRYGGDPQYLESMDSTFDYDTREAYEIYAKAIQKAVNKKALIKILSFEKAMEIALHIMEGTEINTEKGIKAWIANFDTLKIIIE